MKRTRLMMVALLVSLLVPVLAACGEATGGEQTPAAGQATTTTSKGTIKIGTKNFAEQYIIGEMYRLILEDAGYTVTVKDLGATPVAQSALESGEIDLYPEYTGTGLLTVLGMTDFPEKSNPKAVYDTVAKSYKEKFNLVWLAPAPMNNTQAVAMPKDKAEAMGIVTISDFAAKASELRMIGPREFQAREDGLPGIQAAYGNFTLKEYIAVEPGLKYQGLVDGQADVVVAFGTDGEISAFDLVVLQDDKGLFPIYQIAPIVRQDALDKYSDLAPLLDALAPKLTDDVMQELNYEATRIDNPREPVDIARDFLVKEGLIKAKQ